LAVEDGFVNTGTWLGWLAVYSGSNWMSLDEWIYAADPQGAEGVWAFIERSEV